MKHFISKDKKIIPELSDDWKIEFEGEKVSLKSEVLSQYIYDIDLKKLISFTIENGFKINGSEIEGILAVVKGKFFINSEDFQKDEVIIEDFISYDDLIVGASYKDSKDSIFMYLGYRYVSSIKEEEKEFKYTKIVKKHFASYYKKVGRSNNVILSRASTLTKGVLEENNYYNNRSLEFIDRIMNAYYSSNVHIVYFSNIDNKNPKYGLVDLLDSRRPLFIRTKDGLIGNSRGSTHKDNKNKFLRVSGIRRNSEKIEEFRARHNVHSYYTEDLIPTIISDSTDFIPEYLSECKQYRIGIVK